MDIDKKLVYIVAVFVLGLIVGGIYSGAITGNSGIVIRPKQTRELIDAGGSGTCVWGPTISCRCGKYMTIEGACCGFPNPPTAYCDQAQCRIYCGPGPNP